MDPKRKEFAGWVRQKRKDAGLTLEAASRLLGYKSPSAIKRIETGYEPVPVKRIIDFANAYDIPMPELLDKLRELEPRTASEFEFLESKFLAYFMQQCSSMAERRRQQAGSRGSLHMSNYQTLDNYEHPWHHKPFPNVSSNLDNNFLLTEYILSDIGKPFIVSYPKPAAYSFDSHKLQF